jgi:hypothetical protein
VLGEAEGGPERSDSARKLSDVEDEFIASVASRLDSLNGDDTDDDAELQNASAWRGLYWNGRATSVMAVVVFGYVSGSGACREGRPRRRGGMAAQREEREG